LRWDSSVRVLAVNSDSRRQSPRMAHKTVEKISRQLLDTDRIPFYKKIDSTLKGNWCSELGALVKVFRPEIVLIAPAFPSWGRTTQNGIQYLNGHPVSEQKTLFSQNPVATTKTDLSNVVGLLENYFGRRVQLIRRSTLRKGTKQIEQEVQTARSKGYPFLVFDALSDEDLKNICLGGGRLDQKVLWVGSGGLARFLPLGWGCQLSKLAGVPVISSKPILILIGSLNPLNAEQLAFLTGARPSISITPQDEDSLQDGKAQMQVDLVQQALERGLDVALSIRLSECIRSSAQLQHLYDTFQFLSVKLVESKEFGGLIIVGGETAMKLYDKIGAHGIKIQGEVQPGIPYGRWIGGLLDGQPVITKAGGFGQSDTLLRAIEFLRGVRLHNEPK
jgi:D-threonate/D-erythronate kinase